MPFSRTPPGVTRRAACRSPSRVKRVGLGADISEVTNLDAEPSLHYVDGSGRPLSVRPWYRYWVLFFLGVAAWLAYPLVVHGGIGGLEAGGREGGAAASLALALAYALAWVQDVRHAREDRGSWVRRNRLTALRGVAVGGTVTAVCVVGLVVAMRAGDTYVSGLLIGPGTAGFIVFALCTQVALRQRRRAG